MSEMAGFLGNAYLWVKAAHLIFVIFLMAGLFMLPRFFVYHHPVTPGTPEDTLWIEREDRLRRIILNPALVVVWVLGIALMLHLEAWREGWMHAKFALAFALSGYHGWLIGQYKKMKRGERPVTERTLRLLNEVPGVATVLIVILVIVRPF